MYHDRIKFANYDYNVIEREIKKKPLIQANINLTSGFTIEHDKNT